MPICDICEDKVDKVNTCTSCGVDFCKTCGSISQMLCEDCSTEEDDE
ncbi:MAG: hypothetical protein NWE89_02255 [Candidatus Bathyarchaeota archaeon]|nr:hypothetical protein [Candidatus Bathyarchaeota archaeon]